MMDFAALPPEINSARMYAGAGSGLLLAAAAAWEGLASELSSAATSYRAVISELTGGPWVGPSSVSMAAAAAPYVAWMHATAAAAEQTASQLASAVAAYEAAFAATVAPPVIAANRALLAMLVATNIFGQNTPAIAATEAHYAEMWAQDAAAMYGYAGASATATTLTPFSAPTQNTPAGTGGQAAAVTHAAAAPAGATQNMLAQVPSSLQSLASGGASQGMLNMLSNPLVTNFETLSTLFGGYRTAFLGSCFTAVSSMLFGVPLESPFMPAAAAAPAAAGSAGLGSAGASAGLGGAGASAGLGGAGASAGLGGAGASAGLGGAGVSAGLGRAAAVGALSVPQAWGTASPAIRLAATALPAGGLDGLPGAGAAGPGGSFGGMPPIFSAVNASRNGAAGPRSESRLKVIPQMGAEPDGQDGAPGRWVPGPDGDAALGERHELIGLRTAIAELTKETDVLTHSAALLIREALTR
jgi:PPE-repeat protein